MSQKTTPETHAQASSFDRKRDLAIALSSLILGVGATLGASEFRTDKQRQQSVGQTANPIVLIKDRPRPAPQQSRPASPKPRLKEQRIAAYSKYTGQDFLTILKGTVHLAPGSVVRAAPANEPQFTAASQHTVKLKKAAKVVNPVKVQGPQDKEWLLVESKEAEGFVNLSSGPLDTYDQLPRPLTLEENSREKTLKTTSDVQAHTERVLVQDNHVYQAPNAGLEFELKGFTFDATTTKEDLVKQAKNAELLPLSQPVK
jgi:hypothetical protein